MIWGYLLFLVMLVYHLYYRKKNIFTSEKVEYKEINKIDDNYENYGKYSREYMRLVNEFSNSVDEIRMEMDEVVNQSIELASTTEERASNMVSIEGFFDEIYKRIKSNAENSEVMSENSMKSHGVIKEKKTEVMEVVEEFNELSKKLETSKNNVVNLSEKMNEADALIVGIDTISSQTNLLALNASIEAARAGEHGRGFSVVAEEIRKLATETSDVVGKIVNLIKDIIIMSDETKENIDNTLLGIEEQAIQLEKAMEGLNSVEDQTLNLSKSNKLISDETQDVVKSFKDVREDLIGVTVALESVAKMSNNISLTVDEEANSVNLVSESIEKLENLNFDFAKDVSKKIQKSNKLFLVSSPYEPYIIYDKESKKVKGIDIDILVEIFKRNEIEIDCNIVPFDTSLRMLRENVAQIIPNIEPTNEREEYMMFSDSYRDEMSYAFYGLKNSDSTIENIYDLKDKKIGVMTEYKYFDEFDNYDDCDKEELGSEIVLFKKLERGQLDFIIVDEYTGDYLIKNMNDNYNFIKQSYVKKINSEGLSNIAFAKSEGMEKYVEMFNDGFKEISLDGTLENIVNNYR